MNYTAEGYIILCGRLGHNINRKVMKIGSLIIGLKFIVKSTRKLGFYSGNKLYIVYNPTLQIYSDNQISELKC